jgi:hypothetical protein
MTFVVWNFNENCFIAFTLLRITFDYNKMHLIRFRIKDVYSILVNNRLYTPPNEGIICPLWHRSVKNLPSSGWFNYLNNGIKHYFIKENHTLYTQ